MSTAFKSVASDHTASFRDNKPSRFARRGLQAAIFLGVVALAAVPQFADAYYVSLGIPFMAYAVALLGFQIAAEPV